MKNNASRRSWDPRIGWRLIDDNARPTFCTHPYDTPFHLREMYEKEIKNSLDAGTEPREWARKTFPVPNGDGTSVRIVSDFKRLNRHMKSHNWPTESSGQLLRHIDPRAKYFVSMDLTSGYHQIPIYEERQNLLIISTQMGRYKFTVLPQGP